MLRSKIAAMLVKYGVDAEVEAYAADYTEIADYPSTPKDGDLFGQQCGVQLVVWGQTYSSAAADECRTLFRFVDSQGWPFRQFKLNEMMQIDTVKGLAGFKIENAFTANIELAFKLIFGVLAHWEGEEARAIAMLGSQPAGPQAGQYYALQQQCLAEAYAAVGQNEAAIQAYDVWLAEDSTNLEARQNRAALHYQSAHYQSAVNDLNIVVASDSSRVEARLLRVAANQQLERLDLAERDLKLLENGERNVKPLTPDDEPVRASPDRRIEKLQKSQLNIREKLLRNDQVLQRKLDQEPVNKAVLEAKAISSRNLGQSETAERTAKSLLEIDPNNGTAYGVLIEVYQLQGKTRAVETVIKRAERSTLDPRALQKLAPSLLLRRANEGGG
ncbi:MAG: hypothetical protein HC821_04265 [Lewinella sp.]|nr:hypothetical protein [Lewinella sp.]